MTRHPASRSELPSSTLDRPAARLAALGVVVLVAAILGYIHRNDLFPPEAAEAAANDPAAACIAQRAAGIDGMFADGTINAEQASLFKGRAEALCRAQAGQTGAPPLPGQ
jgi:hypothetical protein